MHYQPHTQDRTLKMQHKAPIRSQTLGPAMLGNISIQSTGQRKGIMFANPSTGQIGLMFLSIMS
ncbi:hypothetical protein CF117_19250 [Aeromonas veronii]|nr:hypothetical protein C2849_13615 [Aeromonas veronii]TNI98976.1 hypothetical protein CF117_19250 [Aeromonas veronii]